MNLNQPKNLKFHGSGAPTATTLLNKRTMNLNILLFLSIFASLTSCNVQNTSQAISKTNNDSLIAITAVDTVNGLGNNIMLVYQDRETSVPYYFC